MLAYSYKYIGNIYINAGGGVKCIFITNTYKLQTKSTVVHCMHVRRIFDINKNSTAQ